MDPVSEKRERLQVNCTDANAVRIRRICFHFLVSCMWRAYDTLYAWGRCLECFNGIKNFNKWHRSDTCIRPTFTYTGNGEERERGRDENGSAASCADQRYFKIPFEQHPKQQIGERIMEQAQDFRSLSSTAHSHTHAAHVHLLSHSCVHYTCFHSALFSLSMFLFSWKH